MPKPHGLLLNPENLRADYIDTKKRKRNPYCFL